jgi:hypothetical protein
MRIVRKLGSKAVLFSVPIRFGEALGYRLSPRRRGGTFFMQ